MARTPTKTEETKLAEEEAVAKAARDQAAAEQEAADLDAAALEEGDALNDGVDKDPDEEAPEVQVVRVRAVFNRMRNPYTEATFSTNKVTDVIDLQSKENCWTRDQIAAKVLEIVK